MASSTATACDVEQHDFARGTVAQPLPAALAQCFGATLAHPRACRSCRSPACLRREQSFTFSCGC
eukprot:5082071-Pyramimonas_sp.AAC.1